MLEVHLYPQTRGEPANPPMEPDRALTQREKEVLQLISQGKTSKQIAHWLNLSVYTVNNHRKHICKKAGLHSTAQLVAFAVSQSASVRAFRPAGGASPARRDKNKLGCS